MEYFSVPKPQKYKNNKYLEFMRGKTCQISGCNCLAEPHHENGLLFQRALSSKNDYLTIRLCREHHNKREENPKTFWDSYGMDPARVVIQNLIDFIEGGRK